MKKNFRFKLNLFDGIVLVIGLCLIAVLGWMTLKPAAADDAADPATQTVRYVLRFDAALEGTGASIRPGSVLEDSIKNYKIGTVESVEVRTARVVTLDEVNKKVVYSEVDGYEDVYITVVANCTMGDSAVILDGGYNLRANTVAYVRGEGFVGYGPVISIERGEQ